jgi:hypothetical protein
MFENLSSMWSFVDQPNAEWSAPHLKCLSIQLRAVSWPNAKACSAVKNVSPVVSAVGGSRELETISTMGLNEAGERNTAVIVTTHSL